MAITYTRVFQQYPHVLLDCAAEELNRTVRSAFGRVEMDDTLFRALVVIQQAPVSQTTLADILGVGRNTVTGWVDSLEQRGWAKRRLNREDRRQYLLDITDTGSSALQSAKEIALQACQDWISSLDDDSRRTLAVVLADLLVVSAVE